MTRLVMLVVLIKAPLEVLIIDAVERPRPN
jgi:hypothetical protein